MNTLKEYDLLVHGIIINKAIIETDSASFLKMQQAQARYIAELTDMADKKHIAILPFSLTEVKGVEQLRAIGEKLVSDLLF